MHQANLCITVADWANNHFNGSLINDVSNTSLTFGLVGGTVSSILRGVLTTIGHYSNGNSESNFYNANIGPWGSRLISSGNHPIYSGEMEYGTTKLGYVRYCVGWKVDTHPNTSIQIQPDEDIAFEGRPNTAYGSRGCIAIQEYALRLNMLYNWIYSRSRAFGMINLFVNY